MGKREKDYKRSRLCGCRLDICVVIRDQLFASKSRIEVSGRKGCAN